MITFAFSEFFYYSTLLVLAGSDYLKVFSNEQMESLAYLLLRFYNHGGSIFMVFYGLASIIRGYLMFRSDYIPRWMGVLLILAGTAFVLRSFLFVLFPAYALDYFLLPMAITVLCLGIWFLVKGVNKNAPAVD
jgi:hypothetical protein